MSALRRRVGESFPLGRVRKAGPTEGLDMQPIYNRFFADNNRFPKTQLVVKWLLMLCGGIVLAILYYGIHNGIAAIVEARMDSLDGYMRAGEYGSAFIVAFFSSLALVVGAVLLVIWEPVSGSSSMPEILCLLNGARVDRILSVSTFVCKALGLLLAVSSGLVLGPEGPTIYLGAVTAYHLTALVARALRAGGLHPVAEAISADRVMQSMVVIGAATGIATAFRSPIGGVMFVLEEAISFFDSSLIWRTYFCCVVAYYILELLFDGVTLNTRRFTEYALDSACDLDYAAEDVFLLAIVGAICGLLGAVFNHAIVGLTALRMRYINHMGWRRLLEATCVTLLTALIIVYTPITFPQCSTDEALFSHVDSISNVREKLTCDELFQDERVCMAERAWEYYRKRNQTEGGLDLNETLVEELYEEMEYRVGVCPVGQYSQMATLLQNSWHHTVGVLFAGGSYDSLNPVTLVVFLLLFFLLAIFTAGTSMAAGLVIPMLIIGATLGRVLAVLANMGIKSPLGSLPVDPGPWAMIGAAAFWSGSGRITVTIAIVILEITGDFRFLPPMAICVVVSKIVGDRFGHGLYHELIHLKDYPYLEADAASSDARVSSCMTKKVVHLSGRETLANINIALASSHNGFPVVRRWRGRTPSEIDGDGDGHGGGGPRGGASRRLIVCGLILRKDLVAALPISVPPEQAATTVIDVYKYMNETPATLIESSHLAEARRIFRFMGLRHLIVIDDAYRLKGIITRRNLMEHKHSHGHGHGHGHGRGLDTNRGNYGGGGGGGGGSSSSSSTNSELEGGNGADLDSVFGSDANTNTFSSVIVEEAEETEPPKTRRWTEPEMEVDR